MPDMDKEVFATFHIGEAEEDSISTEDASLRTHSYATEPRDDDDTVAMVTFEESLSALEERIECVQVLHGRLQSMDQTCDLARQQVLETAKNLITAISQHEERLLADIEDFRETQYKKCGTSRGQFDALVYDMKQEHQQLRMACIGQSGFDVQIRTEAAEGLEILEKKLDILNVNTKAEVDDVAFSAIRCNTAFGAILPAEHSLLVRSPAEKKKIVRSLSLTPNILLNSGTIIRTKSPEPFQRSSFGSLSPRNSTSSTLSLTASCNSLSKPLTLISESLESVDVEAAPVAPVSPALPKCKLHRRLSHMGPPTSPTPSLRPVFTTPINYDKCLWKVNTEGAGLGQVNCPNDILFLDNGTVVVSDRDNLRLQVFDSQGKAYRSLASGKVKPRRLALTQDGHLAVTDSQQNTVRIISLTTGEVLKTWSNKKKILKSPCGIAVTKKSQIIVSDLEKHALMICNKDGKSPKPLPGCSLEFHSPSYITVDANDRVYVSDSWLQTLYVFDKTGKLDFEVTKTSPGQGGHLKYPNGMCVDGEGQIYAADWGNHTVSKFSASGRFLEHVLTREDGILHPAGVAVHGGCLGVTEYSDEHSAVGVYDIRKRISHKNSQESIQSGTGSI